MTLPIFYFDKDYQSQSIKITISAKMINNLKIQNN